MTIRLRTGALALFALITLAVAPVAAQPAAETFDPRSYQGQVAGELTQVLVLGTPHLSSAPDSFDPAVLEPLLSRLAAFRPNVIAIENLSGEEVQTLMTYTGAYPGVAADYATRIMALMAAAREATGLDIAAADFEMRRTLANLSAATTAATRRRLAAVMMAAGDPMSALVQWRRLASADRAAGADFSQVLVDGIEALAARRNESQMIGASLAARLDLDRLYPMDDHTSDDVLWGVADSAVENIYGGVAFQQAIAGPEFASLAHAAENMRTADETLATYRQLNAPSAGLADARGQWLPLLQTAYPDDVGRKVIAAWETRNLRMAAHIREAAGSAPGGRVLVIVGSAHKAWLDAYLGMMSDMRIVSAPEILR